MGIAGEGTRTGYLEAAAKMALMGVAWIGLIRRQPESLTIEHSGGPPLFCVRSATDVSKPRSRPAPSWLGFAGVLPGGWG
jgi:hypothetical protein